MSAIVGTRMQERTSLKPLYVGPGKPLVSHGPHHLAPADHIEGTRPDCRLCTWVYSAHLACYLKYIHRACILHGQLVRA